MTIFERFMEAMRPLSGTLHLVEMGPNNGADTNMLINFLDRLGKPFQYFALEPDLRVHPEFLRTLGAKAPRVQLFPYAVGAKEGTEKFFVSGGRDNWGGRVIDYTCQSSLRPPTKECLTAWPGMTFAEGECQVVTLDGFCKAHGIPQIDFLWADVQGAEADLIAGGQEMLKKTRWFYTEYECWEIYKGALPLDKLAAILPGFELVADYKTDALFRNTTFSQGA